MRRLVKLQKNEKTLTMAAAKAGLSRKTARKEVGKTAEPESAGAVLENYCESAVVSPSQGQIEHFRPKSSVRQTRQQPKIRPGYYWLAYCWENLLVICGGCNVKKSDLFPLEDPSRRARSHHDDITAEDPLLVDPSSSNPRLDIRFKSDAPIGITKRGRTTIKLLGLDHPWLSEERRVWLDRLQRYVETLRIFGDKAMSREEASC